MSTSEVEQIPAEPLPEGSDLPPIDPVKLVALLNRLMTHHQLAMMRYAGVDEKEESHNTGAYVALSDLKKGIVEHHHDLEAETA